MRSTVSAIWAVAGSALLLASACSSSGSPASGTGGKSGSGGASNSGGSTSSGGSVGTGGSASGGAPGSGGSSTGGSGTGGAGTGGTGTGGRANTGGMSVTGGSDGGGGKGGAGGSTSTGGAAGGSNQDAGTMADAVVVHDGATMTGGAYVRTGWTATYTCSGGTCPKGTGDSPNDKTADAFDGNIMTTRWSTDEMQETLKPHFPLFFTVDMKDVFNVSKITMHPSCRDIFDVPGTLEVYLSTDGTNFGKAVVTAHHPAVPPNGEACPPTATAVATDTITFPSTAARYIQIKATETLKTVHAGASDRYWAIGEFNAYP